MTTAETLEACRDMAREVNLLERLVDSVSIPGPCLCAPRLTGMPRGGNDNTSAAIAKLEQYEKWRDRSRALLDELIDRVDCILAELPSEDKMLMRPLLRPRAIRPEMRHDHGVGRLTALARTKNFGFLEKGIDTTGA